VTDTSCGDNVAGNRVGRKQRVKAGRDRSVSATCCRHRLWKWSSAWGKHTHVHVGFNCQWNGFSYHHWLY